MNGITMRTKRFYMELPMNRSARTMAMYLIISEIKLNGIQAWQL